MAGTPSTASPDKARRPGVSGPRHEGSIVDWGLWAMVLFCASSVGQRSSSARSKASSPTVASNSRPGWSSLIVT